MRRDVPRLGLDTPHRSRTLREIALDAKAHWGYDAAFLEREGPARIIVEHPAEAARLRSEQPQLQVSWSPSPIAETETAIRALGGRRIALAPLAAVPHRLAIGPLGSSVIPTTALVRTRVRSARSSRKARSPFINPAMEIKTLTGGSAGNGAAGNGPTGIAPNGRMSETNQVIYGTASQNNGRTLR